MESLTLRRIRWFLWLIVGGATIGMAVELVLMGHHEDVNQFVPLALAAAAVPALVWAAVRPGVVALRALQFVMLCYVGAGIIGIALHAQANAEFQWEMDPAIGGLDLVRAVVEATAPPAFAPGLMVHLGLLGLVYTYRHPALREDGLDGATGDRPDSHGSST